MESFQAKLNEIKRAIDEDIYRRRVLLLCQQFEPKSFDEYSSSGSFRRLEKFESSTYSEVLKAIDLADNNKPVVMKIMRALSRGVIKRMPSITTKGCQSYNDILNELVVTQALSQLHDGVILNGQPNALYRTHFFCQIHEIKVVSGNLNRQLQASQRRATFRVAAPKGSEIQDAATGTTATGGTTGSAGSSQSRSGVSETLSSAMVTNSRTDLSDTSRLTGISTASSAVSALRPKSTILTRKGVVKQNSPDGEVDDFQSDETSLKPCADADSSTKTIVASNSKAQKMLIRDAAEDGSKIDAVKGNEREAAIRDDELNNLPEDERMLMEALPHEYVVSVMRHDGQPLWWWMTHKKLTPEQLTSVLVQVIVGLAIAENVYLYEHRDLHVSNILIKRTASENIPFILDGQRYNISSHGIKATIIDATFSRLTHNGKVYYRDLTSTLRAYGTKKTPTKMSLQNRSYRQMVRVTKNKWEDFTPKTNLIWLTYLCETLMKNEVLKTDAYLLNEIRKIRDYTLKVKTTFDLLACFPFQPTTNKATAKIGIASAVVGKKTVK